MDFIVYDNPCLLLETLELVYAMFNDIPVEKLTADLPYCIPVDEAARIQAEVCEGLNLGDEELRFYFQGVPIKTKGEQGLACLAFNLLHCKQTYSSYEVDETVEEIKKNWRSWRAMNRYYHVSGIDMYSLSFEGSERYTSLATEISRLPVPSDYQLKLVEVFSRYEDHVDRLGEILTPGAERLKPLLEPWVAQAAPRRQQWREYLSRDDAMSGIIRLCDLSDKDIRKLTLSLHYFVPTNGGGIYQSPPLDFFLHLGVGLVPGHDRSKEGQPPNDGEYTALRLLTRQECVNVFRATREKPKCIQDLSQELGMNPGTVFRYVNNMFNVGLLKPEIISGRSYYWANIPRMEKLAEQLIHYLKEE